MASKTHAAELVDVSIRPGHLTGIFVTAKAGDAMIEVTEVMAIAGTGLSGDRYANSTGFYSHTPTTPGARHVTLIADEDLTAAMADIGIAIGRGETRRNLTTEGVDLESLIGRRFAIGAAVLEGVRRCPPAFTWKRSLANRCSNPWFAAVACAPESCSPESSQQVTNWLSWGPSVGATDAVAE